MAGDGDLTFDGLTLDMSGLVDAVMPKLIKALSTNGALRQAIVQAIMPEIQAQMASLARSTAGAGTTTPRTGPAPPR